MACVHVHKRRAVMDALGPSAQLNLIKCLTINKNISIISIVMGTAYSRHCPERSSILPKLGVDLNPALIVVHSSS